MSTRTRSRTGRRSCSTGRPGCFEIIRSLIDEIRLVPEGGALEIELRGELAGILALASESTKARGLPTSGLAEQIKMVADLPPIIKRQSGAVTPQGFGSALPLSEECSTVLALSRTRRASIVDRIAPFAPEPHLAVIVASHGSATWMAGSDNLGIIEVGASTSRRLRCRRQ